jgi:putative ABC transport system permease protein
MRIYSALLLLYPASFRAEYAAEMRSIFEKRRAECTTFAQRARMWLDTVAEVVANALGVHWDVLRQDVSYAIRGLARSPGFALTAVLVTALGIGANTAAFSVADFVLLRPLPYPDADKLVKLWQRPADGGTNELSPAIYREWKNLNHSFTSTGAYFNQAVNLVGQGDPQRLEHAAITPDLLPTLGVRPFTGRLFTEEDGRTNTGALIISYSLWQSLFAGDPGIVGKQLSVNGLPRVVVGVMPGDFHFPSQDVALWTPILPAVAADTEAGNTYWKAVGRLKSGVSVEQATADLSNVTRQLRAVYPDAIDEGGAARAIRLRDELSPQSKLLLIALCAAAGCVLLIACANFANLLLARALMRRRELLVRSALGAGRERIVRQSVTESLLLATLGGALGVGIAVVAVPLLAKLVPNGLPIARQPSIDVRVLMFAGVLVLATAIFAGILPAWRSVGREDLSALREGARAGGGRKARARSVLVIAEVMASVVLLISAGLLMRALLRLENIDPGFRTENVLTMRTSPTLPKYDSLTPRVALYRDILDGVRGLPGVTSAAYTTGLPMEMWGGVWEVIPDGDPQFERRRNRASSRYVTRDYFTTMSIPLKAGRDIAESDDIKQPYAAVVSESFVTRYFPHGDPLGRRFRFQNIERTVVGVVGDVRVRGVERESEPQVYLSYKQDSTSNAFFMPKDLVIHATVPASSLIPAVRRIVQRVDPDQPVSHVRMLADVVANQTAARAVQVRVVSAFALIAFLLAAVGIHGLLSFSVSSRRHEFGVRMALGAQKRAIVRMVMRHGVLLTAAGVLPGIAIAYLGARAMQSLLAGVNPADVATFGAAGLLCVVMTLVGTLLPTLRAVRVDPAVALREDV